MVVVNRGRSPTAVVFQHRREIGTRYIAVLAGAGSPFRLERAALAATVGCSRVVAHAWGGEHVHIRYIPVLINHVPKAVELVARFDIVSTPPAALEESHVFVKLIVLTGVVLGILLIVRSCTKATRHIQGRRNLRI